MKSTFIESIRKFYGNKAGMEEVKKAFNQEMENRAVLTVNASTYDQTKTVADPELELRVDNLVEKLGILYINGLTSNLVYPIAKGQTCQWIAETAQGNLNGLEFDSVTLTPHRLFSYCEYDRDVILQTNANVEAQIAVDLLNAMWEAVQTKAFGDMYPSGEGAADLITSIADYDDIVALELAAAQAKIKNGIYLVSPTAASKLKSMLNSVYPVMVDGKINGHPVVETACLDDEKIIFGDFSKLLIGQFSQTDLTVDKTTQAYLGIIRLILNTYWDAQIINSDAFLFASTETASDDSGEGGDD